MTLMRTIAFRLFLLIASVQSIILFALTYAAVQIQQNHIMETVLASANRASDLIVRSTRHSMMLNHKEDVHSILTSVGAQPGFEGIRIYNKQGVVVFGTIPGEINTKVDLNAEACVSCHPSARLATIPRTSEQLTRIFSKPGGDRVLGLITPIPNEVQCSDAACHAHPGEKTILGVLDVKLSLAQVDAQLFESRNNLLLLSLLALILISTVSGAFIWYVINRPAKRLMQGMNMVSSGRLDQKIDVQARDEFGALATTFNRMTEELARARGEITAWSHTLEQKVEEKTADLARAHKHVMTVEKMASLGNLAATVAHELNNPLEGILTFARLLIKRLQKGDLPPTVQEKMREELKLIADESLRCGNIVKNLLVFARKGGGAFEPVRVKTIVDRCTLLMNHHAEMHAVACSVICSDDVVLECDAGQLQQAIIALMVNGIEAMATGGTGVNRLDVEAASDPRTKEVIIRVADTGCGMSDEVKAKIFEPFFTTKSEGKGVGLGLAVVYGIVQRHGGTVGVESTVGKGTTFTLRFPARQRRPGPEGVETKMTGAEQ